LKFSFEDLNRLFGATPDREFHRIFQFHGNFLFQDIGMPILIIQLENLGAGQPTHAMAHAQLILDSYFHLPDLLDEGCGGGVERRQAL
jgi:hypothetical protein